MKVVLQDIVRNVSKAAHLTLPDSQVVVRKLVSTLQNALLQGQKIEIRDFGVFQVKLVSGKKGHDFSRGTSVPLAPYKKISFKAGKNLKKLFRDLPAEQAFPSTGGQLEMWHFKEKAKVQQSAAEERIAAAGGQ